MYFPSLKIKVKLINVNIKNSIMNVVFWEISHESFHFMFIQQEIHQVPVIDGFFPLLMIVQFFLSK